MRRDFVPLTKGDASRFSATQGVKYLTIEYRIFF